MGAKGDFAAAYVVAHEVAHHVQNELGILAKSTELRQQVRNEVSNAISVRVELQADCYSGIWARHAGGRFGSIERGDIAEAMNAAKQIGDDTLQRNAGQQPMRRCSPAVAIGKIPNDTNLCADHKVMWSRTLVLPAFLAGLPHCPIA